jgi:rhodanese-related sulfurtransferase
MSSKLKIINAVDLFEMLNDHSFDNFVIIDARDEKKYLSGHIKGAVNIDISKKGDNLKLLNYLKKSSIFVYCDIGIRSETIIAKLKDAKYAGTIYNIIDGFEAWNESIVTTQF